MLFHASFYSSAFSVSFILFNQMIRSLCTEKIGKEARMRIEEGPYFRGLVTIWGLSGQEVRRTAAGTGPLHFFRRASLYVARAKERTDVVIFLAETRTLNNRSHSHFYVVYYWYHRSNTDDENSQTESNRLEEWAGMIMFEIMIYTFRLTSMAMFNVKRCMEF